MSERDRPNRTDAEGTERTEAAEKALDAGELEVGDVQPG